MTEHHRVASFLYDRDISTRDEECMTCGVVAAECHCDGGPS